MKKFLAGITLAVMVAVGGLTVFRSAEAASTGIRTDVACNPLTANAPLGATQTCRVRVRNYGPDTATSVAITRTSPYALQSVVLTKGNIYSGSRVVVTGPQALTKQEYLLATYTYTVTSAPDRQDSTTCTTSANYPTACGQEQLTLP